MGVTTNDIAYQFDGTFPGLMSVIYHCEKNRKQPYEIVPDNIESRALFSDYIQINTDIKHAEKVITAVRQTLSRYSYQNCIHTFLSNHSEAPFLIYRYLHFGWQVKKRLDNYLADQRVKPLLDIAGQVRLESHRILGLVRFRETPYDLYYAQITPDNNVLPLIASHFSKRMASQNWIIHDTGRNLAARYTNGEWDIVHLRLTGSVPVSGNEDLYRHLWKNYYRKISIKERNNPRQQKQYMPQRYWKNLVEEPQQL